MRSRKVLAAAVALLVLTGVMSGSASAQPTSTVPTSYLPSLATQFGARWLASQFDPAGFVPGLNAASTYSNTAQAVFALGQDNVQEATARAGVAWLETNAAASVPTDGSADPGVVGYLLLAAAGTGEDPTSFGGLDLVTILVETMTVSGLYGTASPTNDGVFRQSLAIAGLAANGQIPDPDAVDWLIDQQCGDTPAAAVGGWQAYRADTSVVCAAPDPSSFSGPDTNSTAAAIWALSSVEEDGDGVNAGLDFLTAVQDDNGGFAFSASTTANSGVDPNSTALVIRAILSAGDDPWDSPWIQPGGRPYDALFDFQIGCDVPPADIGAFTTNSAPGADLLATTGAVWGASTWDLDNHFVLNAAFPDVCADNPFQLDIALVAGQSIIEGYPDGSFRPVVTATRQVFAAYLYRMEGEPAYTPPPTPTFSDVPTTNPFYTAIEWANSVGIIQGYSNGTFRPANPLTRQSGVVLLYRFLEISGFTPPATPTFSDVPTTNPFYTEIEWAQDVGLVNGYANGTFGPTNPMSRQTSAALIARSYQIQI